MKTVKTSGKEYFYSISGLIVPKYMVEEGLTEKLEYFVNWVPENADQLETYSNTNAKRFIAEMEHLYEQLCSIHAHWLEIEAAKILRVAEINEGELNGKLVVPFIANMRTLALDIQMAQISGFESSYRQRNEIERYKDVISSMKILAVLVNGLDFEKAFDIAISINELRESEYAEPLMEGITSEDKERTLKLIEEITVVYAGKIDSIINAAAEAISLKTLLIADDMPEILTSLSLMLMDYYQVFCFTNGKEALDFINKKQGPDAFLLDVDMPEMDGFALAKEIRSRPEHESTPIIFLTGNSTRETFYKSRLYNATAFIVKPLNRDMIISKLSSCLGA